jgi:hypothetical protein
MADIPHISGVKTKRSDTQNVVLAPPAKKPKIEESSILTAYPDLNAATIPPALMRTAIGAAEEGVSFNLREALHGKPRGVGVTVSPGYSGFENAMRDIMESIFGDRLIRDIEGRNEKIKFKLRNIYELTTPTAQCRAVIGPVTGTTECWICGIPIQYGGPGMEVGQCDHVLPIIQAVMFLGLYSQDRLIRNRITDDTYDPRTDPALQLEYRYTHQICNSVKNDIVLIGTGEKNTWPHEYFSIKKDSIRNLLHGVWTNTSKHKVATFFREALMKHYGGDETRYLTERTIAITEHLRRITSYLNSASAPGLLKLRALANLISTPTHKYVGSRIKDANLSVTLRPLGSMNVELFYDLVVEDLGATLGKRQTVEKGGKREPLYVVPKLQEMLAIVAKEESSKLMPFLSTTAGQRINNGPVRRELLRRMRDKIHKIFLELNTSKERDYWRPILMRVVNEVIKRMHYPKLALYQQSTMTPSIGVTQPAVGGAGTANAAAAGHVEPIQKDAVMDIIQSMITLNETAPESVAAEEERINEADVQLLSTLKHVPYTDEDNINYGASLLLGLGRNETAGGYRKTRKRRDNRLKTRRRK